MKQFSIVFFIVLCIIKGELNAQINPMPFLPNNGLCDKEVVFASFFSHTRNLICHDKIIYQQLIKDTCHVLKTGTTSPFDHNIYSYNAVNVHAIFVDCNKNNIITGTEPSGAYANFFIGNDSTKWSVNVPYYNKVLQKGLYDGIDLEYVIKSNDVEYNFRRLYPFTRKNRTF